MKNYKKIIASIGISALFFTSQMVSAIETSSFSDSEGQKPVVDITNNWSNKTLKEKISDKLKEKINSVKEKIFKLSQKLRDSFDAALDKIADEKKLETYGNVILRIDAMIAKTTNENLKAKFQELKDIVQAKIDKINKDNKDSNMNQISWS